MNRDPDILVIPRDSIFLRFIELPSTRDDEIKSMIEFQVLKEIPMQREDMVIGYRKLGSYRDGFSMLMLALGDKKKLMAMLREKEAEGKKVDSIRLHTELLYLYLLQESVISRDKVGLVIHIAKEHPELMVIDKDRPIFSRGAENLERFLEELDFSLSSYKRIRSNPEIEYIVVSYTSDVDTASIRHRLEQYFKREIDFYECGDILKNLQSSLEIDLMPEELSKGRSLLKKRKEFIFTSLLLGILLSLIFLFIGFKIIQKDKFLRELSAELAKLEPLSSRLGIITKKVELADRRIKEGIFILDILRSTEMLVPPQISISSIEYDGGENIFYKGVSSDMSYIMEFVKQLSKTGFFKNVEIRYASRKDIKGQKDTEFNIECLLRL